MARFITQVAASRRPASTRFFAWAGDGPALVVFSVAFSRRRECMSDYSCRMQLLLGCCSLIVNDGHGFVVTSRDGGEMRRIGEQPTTLRGGKAGARRRQPSRPRLHRRGSGP